MHRVLCRLILLALLGRGACLGQMPSNHELSRSDQVDSLFVSWNHPDSPGASVAVLQGGMVVHRRGYGVAQLEYGIPITPSTIFHVASVSKEFTAFAVGLLVDQGRVNWDDDIRKYIPEVPDFGTRITLHHLVTHTGGLRDQWELLATAGWRLDDVITREQILQMVSRQRELNFSPGEEYLYCNTGFTLLAEVVARVTGKSFREWTKQEIFEPLGMSSTHFHDDHQMIVPNRAYSYSGDREHGFRKSVLSYANVGATSLFTTVEDMMNWARNFQQPHLGSSGLLKQMQMKARLNSGKEIDYGMGLAVGTYRGHPTIGHGGADAGFRSHFLLFPEDDFAVMVMSNLASFDGTKLTRKIADIYLHEALGPEPEHPPLFLPVLLPEPVRRALNGHYLAGDAGFLLSLEADGDVWKVSRNRSSPQIYEAREEGVLVPRQRGPEIGYSSQNDRVEQIELRENGAPPMLADRVELMELTPARMAEFSGLYYAPELDTSYRIQAGQEALEAVHQRHPPIPLKAGVTDQFYGNSWFFGNIRFERNSAGRITGFRLQGGRVRNLWFEKR